MKEVTMPLLTRREVTTKVTIALTSCAIAAKAIAHAEGHGTARSNGISRNCECIHQEIEFAATPSRVYKSLTDAKQFGKATEAIMPGAAASTVISPHVGGEFSMFKGIIVGRHIEILPDVRLVQAWREKDWAPGLFSIVRFQLVPTASGTRLIFDHTGFPQGAADHLAVGWKSHYWEPLQKYLA
jgi:activator of HSP90 ATPase